MTRDMAHLCRYDPCCMILFSAGRSLDALKTSHRRDVHLGRVVLVPDIFPSVLGGTFNLGQGMWMQFQFSRTDHRRLFRNVQRYIYI